MPKPAFKPLTVILPVILLAGISLFAQPKPPGLDYIWFNPDITSRTRLYLG